ncbi:ribonuclease H-like domain-containing protein [Tanacetum coccineum]
MYVSDRVDIFDMVDIDLFTVFALNMMVLKLGYTVETQSELPVSKEPDVGPTQEPILAEVSTQEPIMAEVSTQEPIVAEIMLVLGKMGKTLNMSSEDAGTSTDDDDDVDEDFLVDEENEIVKPDVDVHLFSITIDLPFENIGITNLVPDDVLKGEDVDVINADGFDSNPSNDEERNYKKRRLAELRTEMEGVINASVRVNLDILVKAVQDQLQRELEVQISMSKAFRAKAKAEREIRGDHVLQYSIFRDYVVELQSINPNTTIKIAVEKYIEPSFPTRVFQRIYFCLGALKLGFRACRRDLLGLDGAFTKGPFPGQVLVADGLDLNNEIYPLAYALVEAKSKSSWCWFLQCLGDDIDLHPNSNFTFISDRKKGIIPAIKNVTQDQVLGEVHMSNNTFATQASCPRKEEPLHVNPTETLDTIRQHEKDKVERWTKRRTPTQPVSQPSNSSQVSVSETRNADGREMGDGVPTQSSVAGGASEWSFL